MAVLGCAAAAATWAAPGGAEVARCTDRSAGRCTEYRGEPRPDREFNRLACGQLGAGRGVWEEGAPCPAERRVAHCSRVVRDAVTALSFYPPATMDQASQACSAGGMQLEPK